MPIFEYICRKCNKSFSILQLNSGASKADCPECGSGDVSKKISAFSCAAPASGDVFSGGASMGGGGG